MKLTPVDKKSQQDYPVFDDYWNSRRKYFSEAALCAGIVIGAATLSSCTQQNPQIMGDMVEPKPPANTTSNSQPRPPGEMVAPQQPETQEPMIMGKMKMPEKPMKTPMETPPMVDGGMPAPEPPQERVPALRGDVKAPAPPESKENVPEVK